MLGIWRLSRALLAWAAIVAYVVPVMAHAAPQPHAHAEASAKPACQAHHHPGGAAHEHGAPAHAVGTIAAATDMPCDDDGRQAPSMACCVAMCTPALPSPALVAPWTPELRMASDSRLVDGVVALFVTRLDRPPKAGSPFIR